MQGLNSREAEELSVTTSEMAAFGRVTLQISMCFKFLKLLQVSRKIPSPFPLPKVVTHA